MIRKAEALYIDKNIRYRIIKVKDAHYIFDLDRLIFVFLFPFLNWLLPHTVYKITDENEIEKLQVAKNKRVIGFGLAMLSGGFAILLANLLGLIIDRFEYAIPEFIKYSMILFTTIVTIYFRFYLSKKNKVNLIKIIQLEGLKEDRIFIRPQSVKHFCLILFLYMVLLAFYIGSIIMFIQINNFMVLLFSIIFLFTLLILNGVTLYPGKNKIRIKNSKFIASS